MDMDRDHEIDAHSDAGIDAILDSLGRDDLNLALALEEQPRFAFQSVAPLGDLEPTAQPLVDTAPTDLSAHQRALEQQVESWSREKLQAEYLRLSLLLDQSLIAPPTSIADDHSVSGLTPAEVSQQHVISSDLTLVPGPSAIPGTEGTYERTKAKRRGRPPKNDAASADAGEGGSGRPEKKAKLTGQSRKRRKDVPEKPRNEVNGKRLEKTRHAELSKAIRQRLKTIMGVGMDDALPKPNNGETGGPFVPDWTAPNAQSNLDWLNGVTYGFEVDAMHGDFPRIPEESLVPNLIRTTARTAYYNFCKKYVVENDAKKLEKREKYAQGRRRWARKDLKQKRRARAALDPAASGLQLPSTALHFDYMSSEYSSAGEDTPEDADNVGAAPENNKAEKRRKIWQDELEGQMGKAGDKKGWAEGLGMKVLEVRTPVWRSTRLDEAYARLDDIAASQSAQRQAGQQAGTPAILPGPDSQGQPATPAPRAGHVAPSHHRFQMPSGLERHGTAPRQTGETWMWASGSVGEWVDHSDSRASPSGIDQSGTAAAVDLTPVEWVHETIRLADAIHGLENRQDATTR